MSLVTNILDEEVLSDETASKIYRLRWGIEVYYRTLKQTLGHQTLKSTSRQQFPDGLVGTLNEADRQHDL